MKLRLIFFPLIALFWLAFYPLQAQPTPTKVRVRAVSKDAKIIGTGVGGAQITIRDRSTNEILARGVQLGATGDTGLIMTQPHQRGATVYDTPGAAVFEATLLLEEPTVVEIIAEGPLGFPQAAQRTSKTILLVPGQDVLGEGIILEIHGFNVTLLAPNPGASLTVGEALPIRARLTMTCGCPIEPGGLWDADKMRVVAQLVSGGRVVKETSLAYAGETSHFSGELPLEEAGEFELRIVAMDPASANFGMDRRRLRVREP